MTLRALIQIVPFGDEENIRDLYRLDISNTGLIRNEGFGHEICSYRVDVSGKVPEILQRDDESEWEHFHTAFIPEHDRRDGAVALVSKASTLVMEHT